MKFDNTKIYSSEKNGIKEFFVTTELTAPLMFWNEFDIFSLCYVPTPMHKLSSIPITKEMFDFDNLDLPVFSGVNWDFTLEDLIGDTVAACEALRLKFNETADSRYWRALIQLLPGSYSQTRHLTLSYEDLAEMWSNHTNYKLKEWDVFYKWVEDLSNSIKGESK